MLEIKNITKQFPGRETAVLSNLSLSVSEGSSIAVTGPSGSGKSTLLNLIGSLDTPDCGSILFNGTDISDFTETEAAQYRNHSIGFIFQQHLLLPQCTVLENVLVPLLAFKSTVSNEEKERGVELLKRAGLSHVLRSRPDSLSGGECQRTAVVRALINNPKILLADEPTGSLDRENTDNLTDLLLELNSERKTALILVTHAQRPAQKMRRIFSLEEGKLQAISKDPGSFLV